MVKNFHDITISEIVTNDFRTSEIFRKYGIDFCCGGQRGLHDICLEKQLDELKILSELQAMALTRTGTEHIYDDWELDFLADYIQNTHHRYVKSEIPVLSAYLEKIVQVHGGNHPELIRVKELFEESAKAMLHHMEKEEITLFPYIKELLQYITNTQDADNPVIDPSENPLNEMMKEHIIEGNRFKEISQLTGNYTVPADACNTYLVAIRKLETFELDLHRHIHIENNILFPKTLKLEQSLIQ